MKILRKNLPIVLAIITFSIIGCSELEEKLLDQLTLQQVEEATAGETPDVSALLSETYKKLNLLYTDGGHQNFNEHTGDLLMAPTRGADWDDNGLWRQLHQHGWDADHAWIGDYYNNLSSGMFAALDMLQYNPASAQEAEARFLRAFFAYYIIEGWGQVPIREPGAPLSDIPTVLSPSEAVTFVISELEAIAATLPSVADTDPWFATKEAAWGYLAKAYLNKSWFISEDRKTFSFDNADLDKVIQYCDNIIEPGKGNFKLEDDYFDNFTSDNGENSSEMIFCSYATEGIQACSRGTWMSGLHYNQTPSGWNGHTALTDFYNSFEANDKRRGGYHDELTPATGLTAGFLVGQQLDKDGNDLLDRQDAKLIFVPENPIISSGSILETSGYRFMKWIPDMTSDVSEATPGNDWTYLRYSDILLTKAEALLRKGDAAAALPLVNQVRAARGVSDFTSLDEATLLAERGRELYLEGWRRSDLIRYGKFQDAYHEKAVSEDKYLWFPFPSAQIVANPNLMQTHPDY